MPADEDDDVDQAIGSLSEGEDEGDPEPGPAPRAVGAGAAPTPPGTHPNAPRKPARTKPASRAGSGVGSGGYNPDDPTSPWPSELATDIANAILDRMTRFPELTPLTVYDLDIKIIPCDGQGQRALGPIRFSDLIDPQVAPGEMLERIVIDRYHLHLPIPVTSYDVVFLWRKSGRWLTRGKLYLSSRDEILAIRRGQAEAAGSAGYGARPQASPAGYFPPQPPPYAPPPGTGYAPAPPPRGGEVEAQLAQLRELSGRFAEALDFVREGRQIPHGAGAAPAAPEAAHAAGVGAPSTEELITRAATTAVVSALKALGIGPASPGVGQAPASPNAPAGIAAPAPPAPPNPMDQLTGEIRGVVVGLMNEGVGMAMKTMKEGMRQAFAGTAGVGVGTAPAAVEAEELPEPEPAEPAPEPPFHVTTLRSPDGTVAKWPDGSAVMVGHDGVGGIDLKGSLFSNPFVAQQGFKIVEKVADVAKDFATRARVPDGVAQVVRTIPKGAVDGTPRPTAQGVGAPPVSPNAGPAAAPAPRPAPAPPAASPESPSAPRRPGGGFPSV